METPPLHRITAALLALAACGTLALQTGIDLASGITLGQSVWDQALFFTNLTVLAVALICGWTALRGWPGIAWTAGLVVWIVLTGAVYHVLLAKTHNPQGWDVVVNVFQHTAVPIGVALAWVAFAPKAGLHAGHALIWTAWPLIYAIYGLLRGLASGRFPYFFLDPVKSGWVGVGLYILGLGAVFFCVGALLVGIARFLR